MLNGKNFTGDCQNGINFGSEIFQSIRTKQLDQYYQKLKLDYCHYIHFRNIQLPINLNIYLHLHFPRTV